MVTPNFPFGYQKYLLYFLRIVPRKKIPVLVSIGDRKSGYLEMRRTYAQ